MYAIIATGGKQYKVSEGDVIFVEKLDAETGSDVTFDQVLAVGGDKLVVGAPLVDKATVTGTRENPAITRRTVTGKHTQRYRSTRSTLDKCMTEVRIKRNSGSDITGFTVSGHALFADSGADIVCAAISMLTINTINAIEEFLPDEPMTLKVDREKGVIDMGLQIGPTEKSGLLLRTFYLGMTSLEKKYGSEYIRVVEYS